MRSPAISGTIGVGALSSVTLASVLDQSVDCVKLIGLEGDIQYMNSNGVCAMAIADLDTIYGRRWEDLWPEEARSSITEAYVDAAQAKPARFRAFCPTASGAPRWWDVTVSRVDDIGGRHAGFLAISRDVTENHDARQALQIAAAEMKHRLKNTYMMIGSLLSGFARGDGVHEAFAADMMNRLSAISTAQSLFVADEAPCEIARLIPALVSPFDTPACPVVIDQLDQTWVDQGQANAIALVIGELCVNSAKHGALGNGGSIHIKASVDAATLAITWTEHTVRPPRSHERQGGQGLQLIERIIRARYGTIVFDWNDAGLAVDLTFPVAT